MRRMPVSVMPGTTTVGTGAPRPARIVARPDGAWLESSLEALPGVYPLTLHFHGRQIDSGLQVTVGTRGELTFTRRS